MSKLPTFFIAITSIFLFSLTFITVVLFAQSLPLIISEFMSNPGKVEDSNGEWFEVYNPNSESVSLEKVIIKDQGSDKHEITENIIIAPHDSVVMCRNKDMSINGGVSCGYQYDNITLANESDEIILEKDGSTLGSVVYLKDTFPLGSGKSVELSSPDANTSDASSWHVATSQFGQGDYGTPGKVNSELPSPTSTPEPPTPKPTRVPTTTKMPTVTKIPKNEQSFLPEPSKLPEQKVQYQAAAKKVSQAVLPSYPTGVYITIKDAKASESNVLSASTQSAVTENTLLKPWHFFAASSVSLIAMVVSAFHVHRKITA